MAESSQDMLPSDMPPLLTTPYLDASVFIAHIKEESIPCRGRTRYEITTDLFEGARQQRYQIYTSFFTLAEVRRLRESRSELAENELPKINALFAEFLSHGWIVPVVLDRNVGERAQIIGANFGMSPADAVHMASAIEAGCNVLLVWDRGTFSEKFASGPFEGVTVLEPFSEGA